eukprot:18456-Pyramimonas_sp.AAC.1
MTREKWWGAAAYLIGQAEASHEGPEKCERMPFVPFALPHTLQMRASHKPHGMLIITLLLHYNYIIVILHRRLLGCGVACAGYAPAWAPGRENIRSPPRTDQDVEEKCRQAVVERKDLRVRAPTDAGRRRNSARRCCG